MDLYKVQKIEYNYVKFYLILLKCYALMDLDSLNSNFYKALDDFMGYVIEYKNNFVFEYVDEMKSINFKHGNAGVIILNHEYKKIFKSDLIEINKFMNILYYNYSNKISYDYGILGIIHTLKCLNNEKSNEKIRKNNRKK